MTVKIKLKRLGKVREPFYRIIVIDAHAKRDGRAIEEIGKYGPKKDPSFIEVDSERVQHWLSVGAQPTEPVMAILRKTGDWQYFHGQPLPRPLDVAEGKPDKKAVFEAAASEAQGEQDTQQPQGKSGRKKAGDGRAVGEGAAEEADTASATTSDVRGGQDSTTETGERAEPSGSED